MSLTEKQTYFEYGLSGWEPKEQPSLDPFINEELARMGGFDQYGDQVYVMIFLGVCLVRKSHKDPLPRIVGDPRAVKENHGRLEPRNLAGRREKARWLCYRKGEEVIRVDRRDQAPTDAFTWWESEYYEFGKCRWAAAKKLTPEQLVIAGIYRTTDEVPPKGDYYILKTLQQDGYYMEPTRAWIEAVKSTRHEVENGDLKKLAQADIEIKDKARAEREEKEDAADQAEYDTMVSDIIKGEERGTRYSVPSQKPTIPHSPYSGDIVNL